MKRRTLACLLVFVALLASAGSAAATPGEATASVATRRRHREARSVSVGFPFRGSLRHGVLLEESADIRYAGEYAGAGRFYGTSELVQLLQRAAAFVSRRAPGSRLSVGELSAPGGGRITGHLSHQAGRDVDLSFYMVDGAGRPYAPFAFANFDRNGRGLPPNESLRFDDERNWELVSRLVTDPDARVQYIFVADTLRARLLATARARHASARTIRRAQLVLHQPSHGHPHRNHMHVRIYCPPADRPTCEDREPFHAWYPGVAPHSPIDSSDHDGT